MHILERGKKTLLLESENLKEIANKLDINFLNAVEDIYNTKGRIITSGVGKSGHIAKKAAATFASTGTPSFFVSPNDCLHGDFGMITKEDYVILYSKGGESKEIVDMVDWLRRENIPYIAITNDEKSTLADNAKIVLLLHVEEEACPLNLAPTVSSTASLALSDALATALIDRRGFTKSDFAIYHPAGSLGRKLAKVERIMHKDDIPIIYENTTLSDALFTIIEYKLGIAIVVKDDILKGIIVDGDLKRYFTNPKFDKHSLNIPVSLIMNKSPMTVLKDDLLTYAMSLMEGKVTSLVVVENTKNYEKKPIGILHIHDILKFKAL